MSFLTLLSLCLLGLTQVHGQNYQVIFPGQEGTSSAPVYNQQQDIQNPFGSQGRDAFSPGSNEVLGNYFNGNLPPTTVATNRYQPQVQQQSHRLTPFGSAPAGPSQLPFTSSYLAPPASTSLPRQTHFFGNNYDFFRQFHQPGFSIHSQPQQQARQVPQPQQQQSTGQEVRNSLATFQPQTHDPFRSVSPTTSHFFNNFGPSSGTPSQPTFSASPAPSTTAQSFTTTQYSNNNAKNNYNNPFAFSFGGAATNPSAKPPTATVFQPSRPIPPVYQPIQQTSATAATFPRSTPESYISPTQQPRIQQSASPTITYPLTEVKVNSQPAPTQNSFNEYEEAAKALGITHGLRVITTETLSAYPTVSVATDSDTTERIPAIIVTSKRTTDAAPEPSSTEGPSSSTTYSPPQTRSTTNTPVPSTTFVSSTPSPSTRAPIEQNYFVSSTPNYYDEPTSHRQPSYINDNYFPSSTRETEDEPSYYFSSTPTPSSPPPVTYTGRAIASVKTTIAAVTTTAAEQPRVEIVPHSRQREHLFRHSNRVVTTNDLEVPYYVPQQEEIVEEEPEQPIIIPRPSSTTEATTTTTTTTTTEAATTPTTTTTTTTTPIRPRTRPPRPIQSNSGRAVAQVRPRKRQRVVPKEQPSFQVEQKQQQELPRGRHVGVSQGQQGRPVSPYYYNNLKPGLLYTNTNGAYQSYYNGEIPQSQQQPIGLEEIEPQIIDFNIPNKLSPVRPQNENQQDFLSSFPPFVPFPSVTEQPRFQPSHVVIDNQQQVSSPSPSPSGAPGSITKTETGEVYKVGPKGRLLRKRKRVRPTQNRPATPSEAPQASPTPSFIQPEEPNPFIISQQQEESPKFVPSTSFPPFRPSQSIITQEPLIDGPSQSPFQPTTYRPNLNALRDSEDEEVDENEKPSTTTFRSRQRVKVGSAVRSTTEGSAPVSKPSAAAAGSDEEKTKVIASRLKSLERQIRFRNRSKSS